MLTWKLIKDCGESFINLALSHVSEKQTRRLRIGKVDEKFLK